MTLEHARDELLELGVEGRHGLGHAAQDGRRIEGQLEVEILGHQRVGSFQRGAPGSARRLPRRPKRAWRSVRARPAPIYRMPAAPGADSRPSIAALTLPDHADTLSRR